tara:strand:- start:504 stop:1097 length:594 start_codon:yes stop_codon:yes gene_type:complete
MQIYVESLFPTGVMIIDNFIDEHECDEILTYIRGLDMHQQDDTVPVNAKSSFDGVTDIVKEVSKHTAVDDFYDRTTFALNEYANVIGQPELKLSNSWSHIQYEGSYVVDHTHPNSKVSGVLYLNTSKESNNLIFKNPNPYCKIDAPVNGTEFNFTINEIPVGNGRLVMFPSWLEHGSNYNINKTQGRTMISFNSLVK